MSLLVLLLVICLVGLAVYLIHKATWIAQPFKTIAMVVGVAVVLWFVLDAFGVIDLIRGVKVPRVSK